MHLGAGNGPNALGKILVVVKNPNIAAQKEPRID
jgi:hypothetical protein